MTGEIPPEVVHAALEGADVIEEYRNGGNTSIPLKEIGLSAISTIGPFLEAYEDRTGLGPTDLSPQMEELYKVHADLHDIFLPSTNESRTE